MTYPQTVDIVAEEAASAGATVLPESAAHPADPGALRDADPAAALAVPDGKGEDTGRVGPSTSGAAAVPDGEAAGDASRSADTVEKPAKAPRGGMFRSLRNHNYRLFVSGAVVSNLGTWMQRTAQDWLVLDLTGGSGTALGVTVALQFLPVMLFGLWGGMLADRYPKRPVLIAAQSLMGLLAMTMGLLTVSGFAQVWHVFVMAFTLGLLSCVEVPTRQSFAVEMVGREDLPNAIALNTSTFNLARVIGPALAGVLIYWMGTGPIFLLNAISFLGSITALLRMRKSELRTPEPVPRAKGQLREGLRYVARRPNLLLPILIVAFMAIFAQSFSTSIALMAKEVYGAGASSFGIASSAFAVGALGGALLAARRVKPSRRFLLTGAVCFGVFQIVAGLAPTYVTFLILLVPAGMALITVNTTANATLQLGASPEMRGRAMGLYVLVLTGGAPIGAPLVGWLAELSGPRAAIMIAGVLSLSGVGLAVLVSRMVAVRTAAEKPVTADRHSDHRSLWRAILRRA